MTKTEFLNDLIYDMAGYLDTSGVDRLKNAVAYRLKGFQLTSDETLPATDVRDNEWILGRYHVDLIAVGRKEKTIGMYLYALMKPDCIMHRSRSGKYAKKITFHFQRNAIYQYHQKQILTIWHI